MRDEEPVVLHLSLLAFVPRQVPVAVSVRPFQLRDLVKRVQFLPQLPVRPVRVQRLVREQ